jgi:tetratricopeptide (TPR) repeat protein
MIKEFTLSRYTPSMLSHETLEAIFVRRDDLVERLVERVRVSALTDNKHYSLLIGPRGIGKTHIVSLVYHRLKEDQELKERLATAWLREEEWGIASYLDLLCSILRAIHEEYDDRTLAARCDELRKKSPEEAEHQAEELLLNWIGQRTLLVIAENMDEIFAALEDAGQNRLRGLIQNNPVFTFVATSQGLFNGVSLRESPFYGFFEIHHIPEFSFEHAVSMLTNIARHVGHDDLARCLQSVHGRARLRAVHHLAGGNPRIYIIFSQFLTCESLDELVEPVMKTLDDLTPYYQARMSYLTPQQRKIAEFLCERRGAVPVSEIAGSNFMSHQTASGQLRRIRELGYVRSHEAGRDSFYELREPLMRIALEVKRLRGEPIRLIVEFLRLWYSRNELACRLDALVPEARDEREYLKLALEVADTEIEDPKVKACVEDYAALSERGDFEKALNVTEELVELRGFTSDWLKCAYVLSKLGRNLEAEEARGKSISHEPQTTAAWKDRAGNLIGLKLYEEAVAACDMALRDIRDDAILWNHRGAALIRLNRNEEALKSFEESLRCDPGSDLAWRYTAVALKKLGRLEEALVSYEKALERSPDDAETWAYRGQLLESLGRCEQALASYDKALECSPDDALAWRYRGDVLDSLGRCEEALASYDRALEYRPDDAETWQYRGLVLAELGRYEEALVSFDKALELLPNNAVAWGCHGGVLESLGRYEEALVSYDKAIALDSNQPDCWGRRAVVLYNLGQLSDSLSALERSIELKPDNADVLSNRAVALSSLGRQEEALAFFGKALEIDPSTADFHLLSNRAVVTMALGRWEEGATELERSLEYLAQEGGRDPQGDVAMVHNLLIRTQDESTWRKHVAVWIELFARYELLAALGQGLVRSIRTLAISWISGETAKAWCRVWRELSEGHKEMDLPLRLLEAAVEYREKPDERILLRLPIEERTLLEPMLKNLEGEQGK